MRDIRNILHNMQNTYAEHGPKLDRLESRVKVLEKLAEEAKTKEQLEREFEEKEKQRRQEESERNWKVFGVVSSVFVA